MTLRTEHALDAMTVVLCGVAVMLGLAVAASYFWPVVRTKQLMLPVDKHGQRGIDPDLFFRMAAESPGIGQRDAAVTIVVFLDYSCGHCVEFEPVLDSMLFRYPDHVRLVVKYFIPGMSRPSLTSGLAAECAADQGRFADFHRAVFSDRSVVPSAEQWIADAIRLRLPNLPRFVGCLRAQAHLHDLIRDTKEGEALGVVGTPTSFINGVPVIGAVSLRVLDSIVVRELGR